MWADIICKHCGKQFRGKTMPSKRRNYCSRSCGAHVSKNKRHGHSDSRREYAAWTAMRERCNNRNCYNYPLYGARGIKVCERWDSFENFFDDMGSRPKGHSIERIDNDGDYEPDNCKWATKLEQSRNRRGVSTPETDQKIREAIALGLNFRQMAEYVGKPQGSVTARTYYLGLKSGTPPIPKITDRKAG